MNIDYIIIIVVIVIIVATLSMCPPIAFELLSTFSKGGMVRVATFHFLRLRLKVAV